MKRRHTQSLQKKRETRVVETFAGTRKTDHVKSNAGGGGQGAQQRRYTNAKSVLTYTPGCYNSSGPLLLSFLATLSKALDVGIDLAKPVTPPLPVAGSTRK